MYAAPDRDTAHRRLVAFHEWLVPIDLTEVTRLARTMDTRQDQVLAFFDTRASNGPTESGASEMSGV
ncbi:transposase [Nitriliruptor alkaliphilus]|uniref:transposase n=1 Tax=Nitriliruptor alkaliphilus TaxID=427918 RepID=UPI00069788D0|nr:transposase [Nitriliruptor alkaliphilus]